MNRQMSIPVELYEDEVVCYFADRYHTTPEVVLQCFLLQEGIVLPEEPLTVTFRLEDNEVEILKGLVLGIHHQEGNVIV